MDSESCEIQGADQTFDSELDHQFVLESQTAQLQEQVNSLKNENAQLKAQFQQAMKLASEVDKVTSKNTQLLEAVAHLKSENEDLVKRMEIIQRTKDELEIQLDEERRGAADAHRIDATANEKEIAKIKSQCQAEITKISKEIETTKNDKEKTDTRCKKLENDSERLLASAKHYFEQEFGNIQKLCEYLDKPKPIEAPVVPNKDKSEALEKKVTKESQKLQKLRTENTNLEAEVAKLKRERKIADAQHTSLVDDLKKEIRNARDDFELKQRDQKHMIQTLETKVSKLKHRLAQKKQECSSKKKPEPEVPVKVAPPLPQPIIKVIRNDEELEELEGKIAELNTQLSVSREKCSGLQSQIKRLEHENASIQQANDRIHNEYAILQGSLQTKLDEIDELKTLLNAKEVEAKKYIMKKRKFETMKARFMNMEEDIEAGNRQLKEVLSEREELQGRNEQLVSVNAQMKAQLDKQSGKVKNLESQLDIARRELLDRKEVKVDDVLPPVAFKSSFFVPPLSTAIDKVATAPALQPVTKIQSVFKIIHDHYSAKMEEYETTIHESFAERSHIQKVINQFLVNATVLLGMKPLSINEFIDNTDTLVSSIGDLRTNYDEVRRNFDLVTSFIRHFQESFSYEVTCDTSKTLSQINELQAKMEHQKELIAKYKKHIKQLKVTCTTVQKKMDTKNADIAAENSQLQSELSKKNDEIKEMTILMQRQKREIHALKAELSDSQRVQEDTETAMRNQQQQLINERANAESELRERIRRIQDQSNQQDIKIQESEGIITRLKKQLQNHKASLVEKDVQIQKLQDERGDQEHEMLVQFDTEKNAMIESYENTINGLKDQCDSQRKDIQIMASQLHAAQKSAHHAKSKLSQMKLSCERLERELSAKSDQSERDKKIAESSARAQVLAAESNFTSKLDEQKAKWENEKRRLFTFVADQFRQFFNPQETIDESSFRSIIGRVREELSRLVSSDNAVRRLVGADLQQKTDDAVAQIVMT